MKKKILTDPRNLLAAAQAVDDSRSRSCLATYRSAIIELRGKGKSFAFIANFLAEQGGPEVSPQMIHKFCRKLGGIQLEVKTDQVQKTAAPRPPEKASRPATNAPPAVSSAQGAVPRLTILPPAEAEAYRKKIQGRHDDSVAD